MICHKRDGLNYIKEGSGGHNAINVLPIFQVISKKKNRPLQPVLFEILAGFGSIL